MIPYHSFILIHPKGTDSWVFQELLFNLSVPPGTQQPPPHITCIQWPSPSNTLGRLARGCPILFNPNPSPGSHPRKTTHPKHGTLPPFWPQLGTQKRNGVWKGTMTPPRNLP